MIELLVLGSLLLVAVVVIGTLATVGALIGGLVLLPFKLIGWVLKWVLGVAAFLVLGLPLLLVGLALGGVGLVVGALFLVIPVLPFVAVAWLVWRLLRPKEPRPAASGATVVG